MSVLTVEQVQTPRLLCERLRIEHAEELAPLLGDPRVARALWSRKEPPTEASVVEGLAAKVDHWERHGFGMWLVRDRAAGAVVGRGGLQHTFVADSYDVEAGWAIMPARWGEGLATELAQASAAVAFELLALNQIIAFALPDNVASRRVMEKTGFAYERDIVHAGLPHVLYRRRADPRHPPRPLLRSSRRPL
jgi:[ribosomal protein S5]-alanine N-acetyltransferase